MAEVTDGGWELVGRQALPDGVLGFFFKCGAIKYRKYGDCEVSMCQPLAT